jgi:gliding motility-associated lipoprotein GldD
MYRLAIAILLLASFNACRPPVLVPKPQGYFKIDTPARHEYRRFDRPGFPYTFEYPVYSTISDDTVFQGKGEHNPYWINIHFDGLGGEINLTYKTISAEHPFMTLVQESDKMSFYHDKKADNIEPYVFRFPDKNVSGILYTVFGNAATRYQFTATDTVKHFIRGALYFNVTPNADSLKPATDFLEQDIHHMLETLQWR